MWRGVFFPDLEFVENGSMIVLGWLSRKPPVRRDIENKMVCANPCFA
jgi:hypothetical protein